MHTFKYLLYACLFFATFPLMAQDDSGSFDHSDIYRTETAERENIVAAELPAEVRKSFETSEYSDMDMQDVQKVIARPRKNPVSPYPTTDGDSLTEDVVGEQMDKLDSAYKDTPYRMREDKNDIAETYYQDSYDQPQMLSDSLVTEDALKDEKATYYEIEVSGNVASYKLLFSERGDIRNAKIMDN